MKEEIGARARLLDAHFAIYTCVIRGDLERIDDII